MESCRNVIMEFVYREADTQINSLGMGIRDKYNIHEVVAYALNRLPPMFVSTDVDLQIKRRECFLMQENITKITRQALLAVRRDPLRRPQPLEDIELANAPYALLKTQEILGWKNLMWCDLPAAIEDCLETAIGKFNSGNIHNLNKYASLGQRRINPNVYLSKSSKALQRKSVAPENKQKEYDTYMLESHYLVHSLERLVMKMAQNRAQNFPPAELRFIRLEDVLARTLNRLPTLYATAEKGINHLRYYAQMNIGSEVAIIVHESMLEVRKINFHRIEPLIYYRIRHEREQALLKVSSLLNRDVKWQNLREVVTESLDLATNGKVCWQRSQAKTAVPLT
ncbi:late competence development ComFB family protein [Pseudanabaena sp. FACHB-1998]|uniref:late competence development ComFB family protein n=1 Tax=Pseudanabaena sp. FACHB-1998 TaxID=2692858 RepID=UPI0016805764|nr:late competence development ComFB family protein [Pseudanabaena sp. FACHB-1998]MBD2175747.1 late competence development ComFB family protein [Pseudanabaena sp. FACHB-1998]